MGHFKSLNWICYDIVLFCFVLMFWVFGYEACRSLASWLGIEPAPLALESQVPTTGPPGKSLFPVKFVKAPK